MAEQSWIVSGPDGQEYIIEVWRGSPAANTFNSVHALLWLGRRITRVTSWQLRVKRFPVRGPRSLVKERVPHEEIATRVRELMTSIEAGDVPGA